ncbi:MAG: rhamnulokinase [Bacteroidales bacterium]
MNYVAIDLGAGSGRLILGQLKNNKIELTEVHRFTNQPIKIGNGFHWNLPSLWVEIKTGLRKVLEIENQIDGIGIDTWGVDYGLLDRNGNIIGIPYSYRDFRTNGLTEDMTSILSKEEMFKCTGNHLMEINTVVQLFSQVKSDDPQLSIAENLLFMPDLFNYLLTGKIVNEYTISTTSQMLNPITKEWSKEVLSSFSIPQKLMNKIVYPGEIIGTIKSELCEELACKPFDIIAVGSHDTASALAAVPADKDVNWAFLSSGTWSLMGIETDQPILTAQSFENNFTNEGTVDGKIRFLKNITGFWILQQIMHEWKKQKVDFNIDNLVAEATSLPTKSIIDVDAPDFSNPASMISAVQAYCLKTGQPELSTPAEFMKCIVDSLATKYKSVLSDLESTTGRKIDRLHIIGGGSQNQLLNQLTANLLDIEVIAGPVEATAFGNIAIQAFAKGEIKSIEEGRQIIKNSVEIKNFYPAKK